MTVTGADAPEVPPPGGARYSRGTEEFARVLNFSDALFAIALTLLIVTIEVPSNLQLSDRDLMASVQELWPQIFSFLLSFVVIGFFWVAHHRLVSKLGALNVAFILVNLLYLACVAFFPFPTALLGENGPQTLTVVLYAVCAGLISGCETLLLLVAHRGRLFSIELDAPGLRYGVLASLIPVAVFLLSIPVAVRWPGPAMFAWALAIPLEKALDRSMPAAAKALNA